MAGVKNSELTTVYWEDGSLTASSEEYGRRFQDHFQAVFNAELVTRLDELNIKQPENTFGGNPKKPTPKRVQTAINQLPDNKSTVAILAQAILAQADAQSAAVGPISLGPRWRRYCVALSLVAPSTPFLRLEVGGS